MQKRSKILLDGGFKDFCRMTPKSLASWQKRLGLNQKQAAEALGNTRNTFADYLHGKHPIPRYISLACAAIENKIGELK